MTHEITRHRHETRRRTLIVRETRRITPNMIRILFAGDDLADFTSLGFDDHVKLLVPCGAGEPARRDYTPRAFDRDGGTLTLDFAVHEAGPATRWAIDARVGDAIEIGGPRGSAVISPTFDWYLLIGDETALPAIGRRLEELPTDAQVTSLIAVTGADEEQNLAGGARRHLRWIHRPASAADDPAALLAALEDLVWPEGDGFVWIAAEAHVARAARDHVRTRRDHPQAWLKAAGYWVKGVADAHEKLGE